MSPPVPEPAARPEPGRKGGAGPDVHARSGLPPVLLAVFAAGVLGTGARLGLDAALPAQQGVPVSTLLINTVGSFVLGLVVAALPHRAVEWLRAGLTTGLLGSFTTFSAITVASAALTGSGDYLHAGILLLVSVVAGLAAAVAGLALGDVLRRRS